MDTSVFETSRKPLVEGRCNQSGIFGSETGAKNTLALRGIHSSHRLELFWKHRLNKHTAWNDSMPLAALLEESCLTPGDL